MRINNHIWNVVWWICFFIASPYLFLSNRLTSQMENLQNSVYSFYQAEISQITGIVGSIAIETIKKTIFWTFTDPELSDEAKYEAEMAVCEQESILGSMFLDIKFEFMSLTFNTDFFASLKARENSHILLEII